MPKSEWGKKRQCPSCSARFYDMRRAPIVCPSCGAQFEADMITRAKRVRGRAKAEAEPEEVETEAPGLAAEPEAEAAEEGDEKLDTEEEEDYEDLIEDADELGEDDLSEVVGGDEDEEDR